MKSIMKLILLAMMAFTSLDVSAGRIKDMASILGVRENQLIGYGLVVGLDGTGDSTPYTVNSTLTMMTEMGVKLPQGTNLSMKNVASVTVTASLPAFARPGQTIDITVSSFGNAKSLRGGTLLMTPLKGADGQVYAMGQGSLLVASSGESKAAVNHLIVGRIPSGATVERAVPTAVGQGEFIYLELNTNDFTTAARLADAVNRDISPDKEIAVAQDGRTIQIKAPTGNARVAFISRVENLQVNAAQPVARVVINARTGSVVMNQSVMLEECAVAHGTLTVLVKGDANDAGAESNDATKPNTDNKGKKNLLHLKLGVTLGDVVSALNAIGATPQDMLAILQAMKSAGALRAELEII
ncbi:MAG: flagellar basal body P-ring protein FlgI [Gallionellaceae bacterium]